MEKTDHQGRPLHAMLSMAQFEEIFECLSRLAEKLRVLAVLLVNSSGEQVAKKISGSWKVDSILLSTLIAGSYSAAKEMSRILGEESNFQMVLHEGEKQNVFVASINKDFFLIVVFETGVALGMVRLFTKKTIEQLYPILTRQGQGRIGMEKLFDGQFQNRLSEELDRSFPEL